MFNNVPNRNNNKTKKKQKYIFKKNLVIYLTHRNIRYFYSFSFSTVFNVYKTTSTNIENNYKILLLNRDSLLI